MPCSIYNRIKEIQIKAIEPEEEINLFRVEKQIKFPLFIDFMST